ncbi:type II toxin-antitoxin system RelE/ParE family toxin [Marinimicrobium agarilyticum]|uniref:type II toxin-antitoxin system RelE/ParE family toxin n=1 Tax=Marinimicrobium agarilyticum TaxID=306546 RepID=UPI00048322E8|nr:type II toxin-antitoxin system RelE/ParE family toxin [Marinimicrobium agarilyticum]
MYEVQQTGVFRRWLSRVKDHQGRTAILRRIKRAKKGNVGDVKAVGKGVFEMRIPTGPGYRVYYMQTGKRVYLLLSGGDKSSQQADIDAACEMATDIKR